MGGISFWQLLIIAVIVVLLFGTKRLRNLGGDLGTSIKGFKKAMGDKEESTPPAEQQALLNDASVKQPNNETPIDTNNQKPNA